MIRLEGSISLLMLIMQKRIFTIVSVLVMTSLVSGCTWFSPKPTREPMAMLQAGATNFAAKMSSEYQMKLDATLLGKDAEGKAQNLTVKLSANGDVSSDLAALALNSKIKGIMSVNQDKYSLDTELRTNKQAVYAIINGLTGPAAEIPKEYVAKALGKWWKIPLPEALVKPYLDQLSLPQPIAAGAPTAEIDKGSSAVQRIKSAENMFKNVSGYIKNVTYDGSDTIGGLNSYRYVAELDTDKLRDFMIQYNKDKGSEPTAEELAKLDDFLTHFVSRVTLWVSVDGEILDRISLVLKMNKVLSEDGKSSGRGDINLDVSYMNFGKAVTTVEPTGASEFDLFSMLGGLTGASLGADGSGEIVSDTPVVPPITKVVEPVKK